MSRWVVLLIVLLTFILNDCFSQGKVTGTVKGRIVDTAGKQDLSQATVSVTPVSDSSAAQFVFTTKDGSFLVRNLKPGDYKLLITFEGYKAVFRKFSLSTTNQVVDFASIYMQKATD